MEYMICDGAPLIWANVRLCIYFELKEYFKNIKYLLRIKFKLLVVNIACSDIGKGESKRSLRFAL